MRRLLSYLFMALAFYVPGRAGVRAGRGSASAVNWVAITAGFSMAIASGGLRVGAGPEPQRRRLKRLGRNPAARPGIQFALILGLALIESLALYTLVIIFAKVK